MHLPRSALRISFLVVMIDQLIDYVLARVQQSEEELGFVLYSYDRDTRGVEVSASLSKHRMNHFPRGYCTVDRVGENHCKTVLWAKLGQVKRVHSNLLSSGVAGRGKSSNWSSTSRLFAFACSMCTLPSMLHLHIQ